MTYDDVPTMKKNSSTTVTATGAIATKSWILLSSLSSSSWMIGLLIRFILATILPWLMDNTAIPYTDIDYYVFIDGTDYIYYKNTSPYDRLTYRYTPFLAYVLSKVYNYRITSRYLFCIADTICGILICHLRTNQRQQQQQQRNQQRNEQQQQIQQQTQPQKRQQQIQQQQQIQTQQQTPTTDEIIKEQQQQHDNHYIVTFLQKFVSKNDKFIDALWWLYNPLAINICTRGSAESLLVLLPVLVTLSLILYIVENVAVNSNSYSKQQQKQQQSSKSSQNTVTSSISYRRIIGLVIVAGICHGISIHTKLYPIIYTLSYMAYLTEHIHTLSSSTKQQQQLQQPKQQQPKSITMQRMYYQMYNILLSPIAWIFGITTVITFALLTYISYVMYGSIAIQEGLLYHFSRVDHRHNYSIHWYWIYLIRYIQQQSNSNTTSTATTAVSFLGSLLTMSNIGRLLLVPQLILLFISSLLLGPYSITVTIFIQTYIFVIQNKVITAQYFTWYLCLLPLCSSSLFTITRDVIYAIVLLILSILLWLGTAYCLEMQGMAVHYYVWIASIVFYITNINLVRALISSSVVVVPCYTLHNNNQEQINSSKSTTTKTLLESNTSQRSKNTNQQPKTKVN